MSALYIVLPLSLLLVAAAVAAFVWAVRSGQLDDLETPGLRVLGDDDEEPDGDGADREPKKVAGTRPAGKEGGSMLGAG